MTVGIDDRQYDHATCLHTQSRQASKRIDRVMISRVYDRLYSYRYVDSISHDA